MAPDLRGYGDSGKPLLPFSYSLPQLVSDLEIIVKKSTSGGVKPVLVAHDWGGLIASSYAAKHGSEIEKLVLMNTTEWLCGKFTKIAKNDLKWRFLTPK